MLKLEFTFILLILSIAKPGSISVDSDENTQQTLNDCLTQNYCGPAKYFPKREDLLKFISTSCPVITAPPSSDSGSSMNMDQQTIPENQFRSDTVLRTYNGYTYTASGVVLSILQSYPANIASVITKIKLRSSPIELFVENNYMTVLGQDVELETSRMMIQNVPVTWIQIYDISNKSQPISLKHYKIKGNYLKGIKVDNTGFVYVFNELSCNSQRNFPAYLTIQRNGISKRQLFPPEILYFKDSDYGESSAQSANAIYVNIFAFNLRNPSGQSESMISILTPNPIPQKYIIYMGENSDSFYLASSKQSAGNKVTQIHKISISGFWMIPSNDVTVPGAIKDDSFMNEYNGILRVVTTQQEVNGVSNTIFCLNVASLEKIGQLTEFAPGEYILSIQYIESRAYLLTSSVTNPSVVVQLSNPSQIKNLGELKLAGFSNNFRSYDANTVIAFGRTLPDRNQRTRLRVSLFDVTNVTRSRRIADYVLPPAYSFVSADWKHSAFFLSKRNNHMVVQAKYYQLQNNTYSPQAFNGALVFDVKRDPNSTRASLTLRGIVNHLQLSTDPFSQTYIERSFDFENLLYTKSNCMLRIHDFKRRRTVAQLELNCEANRSLMLKDVAQANYNPSHLSRPLGTIQVF